MDREFYVNTIIDLLGECTDKQKKLFRRMYGWNKDDLRINQVIEEIEEERLCQAIDQVSEMVNTNKLMK